SPARRRRRMKRAASWWLFALKALVSAALVSYLLWKIGVGDALQRAREMPVGNALVALLAMMLYTVVSALRWQLVLRALGCPTALAVTTRMNFIAVFFNQFLPTSVGADA